MRLERVARKSAQLAFLTTLPAGFALMVFGHWFLWLFGTEFYSGRTSLAILSAVQVLSVAFGPAGLLLNMSGHERDSLLAVGVGMVVNLALNALWIPSWGIEGAAVATACGLIVCKTILVVKVRKRLRVDCTAVGSVWRRVQRPK